MSAATLLPGFAEPGRDAQVTFRAVLDALSRPGMVRRVADVAPPTPLSQSAAAVALTLLDIETPVHLGAWAADAAGWITFHSGARCGAPLASAAFVLTRELPSFDALSSGGDEDPERSATVILEVAGIGAGRAYALTGPGIDGRATLRVDGLPADFFARWAANHALFPRGVDLILCAGDRVAALPRSVAVAEA